MRKKVNTNINICADQLDALDALALARRVSRSELIREAIDLYLEKDGRPATKERSSRAP